MEEKEKERERDKDRLIYQVDKLIQIERYINELTER